MRVLILAMLFSAASAAADTLPSQTAGSAENPPRSQPLSIWRPVGDGGQEHLQSGLLCPLAFAGYSRTQIDLYDHAGLDVSCNFAIGHRDITVYLTRRSDSTIEDAMAEAKRELFQVRAALEPKPISETRPSVGGIAWDTALYSLNGGFRTAIWMADLDGWTLEYRASYPDGDEDQVLADIATLTAIVQKSAGARLDLCHRSPVPTRTGQVVTEPKALSQAAMMTALLGGGELAAAAAGKPAAKVADVTWCVEQAIPHGSSPLLYWRGVDQNGVDALTDRLTPMTHGSAGRAGRRAGQSG
jgi:hypothetical protein